MLQEERAGIPHRTPHWVLCCFLVFLVRFHLVELSSSSQLRDTKSPSKNWDRLGLTVRWAVRERRIHPPYFLTIANLLKPLTTVIGCFSVWQLATPSSVQVAPFLNCQLLTWIDISFMVSRLVCCFLEHLTFPLIWINGRALELYIHWLA